MTGRRELLRDIFDIAVDAAHPDRVLETHLPPPPSHGRVIVLAAGKAAAAMAGAAERFYLDRHRLPLNRVLGLAVTRTGHGLATRAIRVIEAGHPVPDAAGLAAADAALQLASTARADDLLLVLLSGGGSANWIAPVAGVSLADKQDLTRALLRSGAAIGEINTVRKHLSRIKGGKLAAAASPAPITTLAISDVPFDDPSVIASGPTVADPTTLADARRVLVRYGIATSPAILHALSDPANETPKPGDQLFRNAQYEVVARPRDAVMAAENALIARGYPTQNLGADLEGEAREIGRAHARLALAAAERGERLAIVSGGELTVTVRGEGRGGPNQEYALALLAEISGDARIAALAADTDGADGGAGAPTDPAGVIIDGTSLARAQAAGLDPLIFLDNNDATAFFAATGDLLVTGPTRTNVNDIRAILIDP